MNSLVVLFAVVAAAVAAPLEKRSIGHAVAYSLPAVVSHQSRVDVHSSPAVVAVAEAPVYELVEPVVEARAIYAAPAHTVYSGGSAVSHQSRVDVRTSPAVVEHAVAPPALLQYVAAPALGARSVWAPSLYASAW